MPTKEQILARETRWIRKAGLAITLGVLMLAFSAYLQNHIGGADFDAAGLTDRNENQNGLLAASAVGAVGTLLFIPGLLFLLSAAGARSPRVRPHMLLVVVIGPIVLAAASIATCILYNDAAQDLVAAGFGLGAGASDQAKDVANDHAEDVIGDQGLRPLTLGLALAGALGTGVGALYASMWAGRTGLLSKFWSTLGLAAGAVFVLFPYGLLLWMLYLGLMLGWGVGGRPPGWAAGEAVPWTDSRRGADPRGGDVVPGSGREISEPPLPEQDAESGQSSADAELAEYQAPPRKKRKRRG